MENDKIEVFGIKLTRPHAMAIVRFIVIVAVAIFYNNPPGTVHEDYVTTYSNSPFLYGFQTMCIFVIITQTIKIFEDLLYKGKK
ncbi:MULTISPECIES: hypothetical protein [Anaerococcus]|uniref:Uncharacterized protein n=1 Tax=Anaerococcus cruorum TaxID=3115617 RepID=A0ABW9MUG5_9FIRM